MKNVMNTGFRPSGGGKLSSNAHLGDFVKNFFESIKRYRNKCGMTQSSELSLVNSESTSNKQINYNNVDSSLTKDNSQNSLSPLTETLVVNPLHNSLFGVYLAYENCYLRRK